MRARRRSTGAKVIGDRMFVTIIDARGVLEGRPPTVVGHWIDELSKQDGSEESCHHIRELRPGVLLTACRPFAAISVNAEDGGLVASSEYEDGVRFLQVSKRGEITEQGYFLSLGTGAGSVPRDPHQRAPLIGP